MFPKDVPICFAQSPPLLTYIGSLPNRKSWTFEASQLISTSKIVVGTYVYLFENRLAINLKGDHALRPSLPPKDPYKIFTDFSASKHCSGQ